MFTFRGEDYLVDKSRKMITVLGPHWPANERGVHCKLFTRRRHRVPGKPGEFKDESAEQMLARIVLNDRDAEKVGTAHTLHIL